MAQLVRTRGKVMPVPPPPPQPRELIGVIGVSATETANGIALTLLSVERYAEGHVALFRLLRTRGRFEREFPSPHLEIAVTPERTERYRVWMMAGSGGGTREIEHRLSYAICPAPHAGPWVLEVRRITWDRYDKNGNYKVAWVDTGPWRFTITS